MAAADVSAVLFAAALRMLAPLGAAGRRPRGVVGEGLLRRRRTRRSRRSSPPSSRRAGKQVELVFHAEEELPETIAAALEAGQPPDFAFGFCIADYISQWAFDDRLVDLTDTVGHFSDLFDPDALAWRVRAQPEDRAEGAVRAADGPHDQPPPRLEEPPGAGGFHPRGHPEGVGGFLVVLVRPGPARRAPGHWVATTSGASG